MRRCKKPPVSAPADIAFQGSSCCGSQEKVKAELQQDLGNAPSQVLDSDCLTFLLMATREQSKVENRPPQTAKLPPSLGASLLMAWRAGTKSVAASYNAEKAGGGQAPSMRGSCCEECSDCAGKRVYQPQA